MFRAVTVPPPGPRGSPPPPPRGAWKVVNGGMKAPLYRERPGLPPSWSPQAHGAHQPSPERAPLAVTASSSSGPAYRPLPCRGAHGKRAGRNERPVRERARAILGASVGPGPSAVSGSRSVGSNGGFLRAPVDYRRATRRMESGAGQDERLVMMRARASWSPQAGGPHRPSPDHVRYQRQAARLPPPAITPPRGMVSARVSNSAAMPCRSARAMAPNAQGPEQEPARMNKGHRP